MKRVRNDKNAILNIIVDILTEYDIQEFRSKKKLLEIINKQNSYKSNSTSKYSFYKKYLENKYFDESTDNITEKGKLLIRY
jgi:hypothetical protein